MKRRNDCLGGFKSSVAGLLRRGRLNTFAREEDGAMFILTLFLFMTLLIVSGLSIDLMRYEMQRTRLQATLDRALLAAAHPDQENDRKSVVMDYFKRAGLDGFIKPEDVVVTVKSDGTLVSGYARMDVRTPLLDNPFPFLPSTGVSYLSAPAAGAAAKVNALTEISLVVDVSGSMDRTSTTGNSKIYELRKAAKEFSNLLLCNPNDGTTSTNCTITHKKTSLSLIPYSTQVNVGQTLLSKFTRQDAQTDAYCATFYPDATFRSAYVDPDVPLRQAAKYYRYGGNYKRSTPNSLLSCHTDNWREVVPFEDSPTQMEAKINALGAEGDTAIDIGLKWGSALLHHKAQPVVSALIDDGKVDAAFAGRPFNPATTSSSKFLVLMTDGQNTNHHHLFDGYRTGPSPFWLNTHENWDIMSVYKADTNKYMWFLPATGETRWEEHPYGKNGRSDCFWSNKHGRDYCTPTRSEFDSYTSQLTWQELWKENYTWGFVERFDWLLPANKNAPGRLISNSNDSDGNGTRDIDQRLLDQCTAAKNAGITIYTIEMETPDTATDAMQKCASTKVGESGKPELLHYKVSALDIGKVFSKIAADINKLRLIN
ncbi:Tad domain-containing protein [Aliiroseovarius sp. S2029]|uniref:TadE/TadG family type IV pilus assembly protein n=1 Tax=Aliiroseovarius sp. S2029 TaxID=2936988 RepID=UPI0020C0C436|nr:Tad domain-containing protein [Aliiroseovarius sp. S2029]MCK8483881.1 Tad domain-containing protein [Aliiroseovarius sp. S2029]